MLNKPSFTVSDLLEISDVKCCAVCFLKNQLIANLYSTRIRYRIERKSFGFLIPNMGFLAQRTPGSTTRIRRIVIGIPALSGNCFDNQVLVIIGILLFNNITNLKIGSVRVRRCRPCFKIRENIITCVRIW